MRLSDMHFHLDGYSNHRQVYNQINRLKQYTLCVTNSPDIYRACKSTYTETEFVRFALGAHPACIKDIDVANLLKLSKQTRYIGEVGLDFSKGSETTKKMQISKFNEILAGIGDGNKIFSIHSLRAEKCVLETIEPYTNTNKYIMHWYCGNENIMQDLIRLGCYFSINITQINKSIDLIKQIPTSRILVESDAPKGSYSTKKFLPEMLSDVYDSIGNILGVDLKMQVHENLKTLLGKE